ncbi:hypothetical protein, partial [Sinorhizobium meliloti]|uniref:hypothetical protein n=1 Tax=Rhizobium meliloti TaxID=382 RepID=UPI001AEC9394
SSVKITAVVFPAPPLPLTAEINCGKRHNSLCWFKVIPRFAICLHEVSLSRLHMMRTILETTWSLALPHRAVN